MSNPNSPKATGRLAAKLGSGTPEPTTAGKYLNFRTESPPVTASPVVAQGQQQAAPASQPTSESLIPTRTKQRRRGFSMSGLSSKHIGKKTNLNVPPRVHAEYGEHCQKKNVDGIYACLDEANRLAVLLEANPGALDITSQEAEFLDKGFAENPAEVRMVNILIHPKTVEKIMALKRQPQTSHVTLTGLALRALLNLLDYPSKLGKK